MKFTHFFHSLTLAAIAGMGVSNASSQVATDPVGFVAVSAQQNSDATLSLPLHRQAALRTVVSGVAGNVVSVNSTLVADQFVYAQGVQSDHFYVQVVDTTNPSNPVLGSWFEVLDNAAGTITVDQGGAADVETQGLEIGDTVEVIPFWTLNTLFPNGGKVPPSSDVFAPVGQVLAFSGGAVGVNLAPNGAYIYHSGEQGDAGWYDANDLGAGLANDFVLIPDTFLIVRNPTGSPIDLTVVGSVPMSAFTTPVGTLQANNAQDNLLANPFPVPISLAEAKLFESGALVATTDIFAPVDTVLTFPATSTGVNAAPNGAYTYYNGVDAPHGWYDLNDLGAGPVDSVKLLLPGRGFIVRKQAQVSPGSTAWTVAPPYVAPPAP